MDESCPVSLYPHHHLKLWVLLLEGHHFLVHLRTQHQGDYTRNSLSLSLTAIPLDSITSIFFINSSSHYTIFHWKYCTYTSPCLQCKHVAPETSVLSDNSYEVQILNTNHLSVSWSTRLDGGIVHDGWGDDNVGAQAGVQGWEGQGWWETLAGTLEAVVTQKLLGCCGHPGCNEESLLVMAMKDATGSVSLAVQW